MADIKFVEKLIKYGKINEVNNYIKGEKMDNNLVDINPNKIKDLIYTIRGKQVMIDSDLAILYQVETKNLNKAMKRNIDRFPENFCFRLSDDEYKTLRFQNGTSNETSGRGGRRFNPYVYSEQGIAMLSAILKSDIAVKVSVGIMNAFVEMRRFLVNNRELFSRLDRVELKNLETSKRLDETDKKIEKVFDYIAEKKEVSQKVFFNGQIYDAFSLLVDLVKQANISIILIDNYVDIDTLNILAKKKDGVKIDIYTTKKSKLSKNDIKKFNLQYQNLSVNYIDIFHDRFMILDKKICYHIGASIKDAGNKSFAISKIEDKQNIKDILLRL